MSSVRKYTLAFSIMLAGCQADGPTAPAIGQLVLSNGATHSTSTFSNYNDYDFVLSCMNGESTHWEGWVHGTLDVTTSPSGSTLERIKLKFAPDYFVEREDGTRYYAISEFRVSENHHFGRNSVITGTASGAWQSATGDILVLGFHVQLVYDQNGNPVVEKFTGACP